jgi:acetylornithine/succinyldiaminopimelate/putrescine aminotransferase
MIYFFSGKSKFFTFVCIIYMMLNNRQRFLMHQAQTSEFPVMLEISGAEGNYLIDVQGKRYLDLISGISVSHLGHGNEAVKKAVITQMDKHMHVMIYGEFIQSSQALLAERLCGLLPSSLDAVYLLNSGAEATDVAMKLAKRVTGKPNIIACKQAYHGSTHAALSLNSEEYYQQAYRPLLPGIGFIEFNSIDSLSLIDSQTACVFVEVIRGEAGYIPAEPKFLQSLREACDRHGCLLVFDEIQSGMGKTGKHFAFEHYGIIPDILLLGKALGAGLPIGAVISSAERMKSLSHHPILGHITTFGGNAVVAAAALAGIEELERLDLVKQVPAKEQLFRSLLTHTAIQKKDGLGLMLALELDNFDNTLKVIGHCMEMGLISDWFLFASNKVRIAPPLTISEQEIKEACSILNKALSLVYG